MLGRLVSRQLPIVVLLAGLFAGCGSEEFKLVSVSGRVLVDGQPVPGLQISFEPIGGSSRPVPGPQSIGSTDDEGRYRLRTIMEDRNGAVVGPCRVRIWNLPANQQEQALFDDRSANYNDKLEIELLRQQIRNQGKATATAARKATVALPLRYNDNTELTFDVPEAGTDKADFDIKWK